MFDSLSHDIRYAGRSLFRSPGYAIVAILCLSLGIAANVTVFLPVNTLLLRPLPFSDPDRVVSVYTTQSRAARFEGNWSYPDYRDVGNAGGAFAAVGLMSARQWNIGGLDEPERVEGARITSTLFPMLGITTVLGRGFRADEDDAGKVMLISYGLWQRKFAGDSAVIGRALLVSGEPYTVIGVVQEKIRFPELAEVWLPLEPGDMRSHREWRDYDFVARLAPNVTVAQAQARVVAAMGRLEERFGDTNTGWTSWTEPYRESVARLLPAELPIWMVFDVDRRVLTATLVVSVLTGVVVGLVPALQVSSLRLGETLKETSRSRTREFGVRIALGAQPRDVLLLVLGAGVRLVAIGLAIGVPVALAMGRGLGGLLYGVKPGDPTTFTGIPLLLGAVALLASLVPARRATRVEPIVALRND